MPLINLWLNDGHDCSFVTICWCRAWSTVLPIRCTSLTDAAGSSTFSKISTTAKTAIRWWQAVHFNSPLNVQKSYNDYKYPLMREEINKKVRNWNRNEKRELSRINQLESRLGNLDGQKPVKDLSISSEWKLISLAHAAGVFMGLLAFSYAFCCSTTRSEFLDLTWIA